MSCCRKLAIARIFSIGVAVGDVSCDTFCLISGERSRRPFVNAEYHAPIALQLENPLLPGPPGGNKLTIILPSTPRTGGISSSCRIPLMSLTTQFHELSPEWTGWTSG